MSSTDVVLDAEIRQSVGTRAARRMRREGKVPLVLYGGDDAPLALAATRARVLELIRTMGHTKIFTLVINGVTSTPVLFKQWQVDPVKGTLLHADVLRVNMAKPTRLSVPIELVGEPFGVKTQGGLLDFSTHELRIECLPQAIPERLRVDVSALKVNEHIAVKDLVVGEGIKVLDDPDRVIVSVLPSRVEEAAPVPAAAEPVEPEVIRKGKTEPAEEQQTA
jgi:large subunit ribosomal protein L25